MFLDVYSTRNLCSKVVYSLLFLPCHSKAVCADMDRYISTSAVCVRSPHHGMYDKPVCISDDYKIKLTKN